MTKDELAIEIYNVSHITGEFLLRSGQISNEYFDKYKFESLPGLLVPIARELKNLIPASTEILGGLEMGGIPLSTALSIETNIPTVFVRKKAKDYGTRKLAEGMNFDGKQMCVIEDVVTTGGQILLSVKELRELGAKIDTVLCVIVRDPKAFDILAAEGLTLKPLFTMEEIKKMVEL